VLRRISQVGGQLGFHICVALGVSVAITVGVGVGDGGSIWRFFGGIRCHLIASCYSKSPKHVCRLFGENITLTILVSQRISWK
jgi:hypothetical protein